MRSLIPTLLALVLVACTAPGETKAHATNADDPHVDVIADLVISDLASNAFGNQRVARDCVAVSSTATAPSGALVVAAQVKAESRCGDIDFLWIYTRAPAATDWSEEFLGTRPPCWKGVPDDLAAAVAEASAIPSCK